MGVKPEEEMISVGAGEWITVRGVIQITPRAGNAGMWSITMATSVTVAAWVTMTTRLVTATLVSMATWVTMAT